MGRAAHRDAIRREADEIFGNVKIRKGFFGFSIAHNLFLSPGFRPGARASLAFSIIAMLLAWYAAGALVLSLNVAFVALNDEGARRRRPLLSFCAGTADVLAAAYVFTCRRTLDVCPTAHQWKKRR